LFRRIAMSRKLVLGTTALMVATVGAHAEKSPAIREMSPDVQYKYTNTDEVPVGAAILDQYYDKLSPNGRWGFVYKCFEFSSQAKHSEQIILWALCGDDLKALDISKLGLSDNWKSRAEEWKKTGAAIEAEAKDDPGVAQILKLREAAKADWKAYEAKNHDAIVLYQKLKDGVRTSKSNDKNFDGCWDATYPAFVKAVKATKFGWDNEGSNPVQYRVEQIDADPANYYTVANFGMCAYAAHATGGVLASAGIRGNGGAPPMGWRTVLISKLLDPKLKVKFTDRSLECCESAARHLRGPSFQMNHVRSEVSFPWSGGPERTLTGTIAKMKKDGDSTVVSFHGTVVDGCVKSVETKKIRTWDTAGQPVYETKCLKRGKVEEDAPDDATMGTKFVDGFANGLGVAFYGNFPEEVYNQKAKKFVAVLGVVVKGSPAETPLTQ
jgi:hypothetical protein